MIAHPQAFFDSLRTSSLFGGKLSQKQVQGIEAITHQWDLHTDPTMNPGTAKKQLSYILGTVYREAGKDMYPVREGFTKNDTDAIAHVTAMFNKHLVKTNYALPDPITHKSYFGRGQVQITWPGNYKNIGAKIGKDLYNHPELALELETSAEIAVRGMKGGWFTGVGLNKYFNDTTSDWVNARRIINGTDVATLVAGYAARFLDSINLST